MQFHGFLSGRGSLFSMIDMIMWQGTWVHAWSLLDFYFELGFFYWLVSPCITYDIRILIKYNWFFKPLIFLKKSIFNSYQNKENIFYFHIISKQSKIIHFTYKKISLRKISRKINAPFNLVNISSSMHVYTWLYTI